MNDIAMDLTALHTPNTARFALQQKVIMTKACPLYTMFPDDPGVIMERRYSPLHDRWLYMVRFEFGIYPLPERYLQEAPPVISESKETVQP